MQYLCNPANARGAPSSAPPSSSTEEFARPPQIVDEKPLQFFGSLAFGPKNSGGMIGRENLCAQGMAQMLSPRSPIGAFAHDGLCSVLP